MKVHAGSHLCPYCSRGFYWAHSLRAHIATHFKENAEDKKEASTSGFAQEENDIKIDEIKEEPLLDKAISEDSFAILTSEDITKLGLGTYQIFTIGSSNDDIETFTVYQSECNNNQLALLDNPSNPLTTISL